MIQYIKNKDYDELNQKRTKTPLKSKNSTQNNLPY